MYLFGISLQLHLGVKRHLAPVGFDLLAIRDVLPVVALGVPNDNMRLLRSN